jgi:hypothetical protein
MSHQGYEGWFPECILCGAGNVGPVVCLNPVCHEQYIEGPKEYTDEIFADDGLIKEDNHWWKCCRLCDRRIHADPVAFGSYALCASCFHQYARHGKYPPTHPKSVMQSQPRTD